MTAGAVARTTKLHSAGKSLFSAARRPLDVRYRSPTNPSDLRALAEQSNAWPFEQAKAIVARLKKSQRTRCCSRPATAVGPAAYRHLRRGRAHHDGAPRLRVLTEDKIKTRLLAFSDDMDGLRKVPDNVPNKEMLARISASR